MTLLFPIVHFPLQPKQAHTRSLLSLPTNTFFPSLTPWDHPQPQQKCSCQGHLWPPIAKFNGILPNLTWPINTTQYNLSLCSLENSQIIPLRSNRFVPVQNYAVACQPSKSRSHMAHMALFPSVRPHYLSEVSLLPRTTPAKLITCCSLKTQGIFLLGFYTCFPSPWISMVTSSASQIFSKYHLIDEEFPPH